MEKHSNLIKKIALSFSLSTGVNFDDLFQEASLAYLEALRTHNPNKGKITTYLWHCVHNRLKNYVREENRWKAGALEETDESLVSEKIHFWEFLNPQAQAIAKIALSAPSYFATLSADSAQIKIISIMRKKGWQWDKINSGLKNIRAVFAT